MALPESFREKKWFYFTFTTFSSAYSITVQQVKETLNVYYLKKRIDLFHSARIIFGTQNTFFVTEQITEVVDWSMIDWLTNELITSVIVWVFYQLFS